MKEVMIDYDGFIIWLCHTQNTFAHVNIIMKHTPIYNRHGVFDVFVCASCTCKQA